MQISSEAGGFDDLISSLEIILSTSSPNLVSGMFFVEQFGPDAGIPKRVSLSSSGAPAPEAVEGAILDFLLHDGAQPASQISSFTLIPIAGGFGRAIGFVWFETAATEVTKVVLNASAALVAQYVEAEKKGRFHDEFRAALSHVTTNDALRALQRSLEGGLFTQKVVVWHLDEGHLHSINYPDLDMPPGRGFMQKALDGRIHQISNIDEYNGDIYIPEFFTENEIKSCVAFPIKNAIASDPSSIIGVAGVFYKRPNGITNIDMQLCTYAVDYFSLIWSMDRQIINRDLMLSESSKDAIFIGQASRALVDYHDINSIHYGLSSSVASAKAMAANQNLLNHLNSAERRLRELKRIIDNNRGVLNIAREFSNRIALPSDGSVQSFDISTVILHEIEDVRKELQADRAAITSKFQLKSNIVRMSMSDVKRVVRNLLSNALRAIKSKTQGGGKVAVFVYNPAPGKIAIRVTDNGPGIEPGQIELIFQPFYTTHPAEGGRGLGLFAVRSVALEHGGEPKVKTRWGYFAEFEVWLNTV